MVDKRKEIVIIEEDEEVIKYFLNFFAFSLYAQIIDLEKIVIQKDISSDSFVFDSFEIESLPSFSLEEVVDYSFKYRFKEEKFFWDPAGCFFKGFDF